MSNGARALRFRTDDSGDRSLRASSGLIAAVGSILGTVEAVREIRVLHRSKNRSKFFIVMDQASVSNVQLVVQAMVQIEEAFPKQHFDYDTVGIDSLPLVPDSAHDVALA